VVPRTGSSYLVIFQDTTGPMTRSVADAVAVFDVLAGYDESDPYTVAYTIARAPVSYRAQLENATLEGARPGLVVNAMGSDDDPDSAAVNEVVRVAADAIAEPARRSWRSRSLTSSTTSSPSVSTSRVPSTTSTSFSRPAPSSRSMTS
jgi:Asp-tRNA(Asn)/Glu-tRNA(Gln) amidotransferase A subunit family amidase